MSSDLLQKIDSYFPTPKFLTFNLASIDITPRSIKIMKLKKSKYGLIPDFYKEVKLENKNNLASFEKNFDISNPAFKEVIQKLKKLKNEFDLEYVVVSLPETKTYIYRTKFPRESAGNLAQVIRFSIEENVPLKADEVNFDYFVINRDRDVNDDVDVVVSVFPKTVIDLYTKILKLSDLFPVSFQSEAISLSRSVIEKDDKEAYMILRFLEDQVNVGVVEGGAVQYASIIDTDIGKIVNDFKSDDAHSLGESLNKVLIYWFTNNKDLTQHKKIETVIVAGEYASDQKLVNFLEDKLKIDVEVADVWKNCFSLDKYIPEIEKKDSLKYAVSIGLAIKGIKHA